MPRDSRIVHAGSFRTLFITLSVVLALGTPFTLAPSTAEAVVTDTLQVFTVPSLARPFYLVPQLELPLASIVMRIANDAGASTSPVPGTWGMDARHVYSKQQGWNADQTLLSLENRSGGAPSPLILDGWTYRPRLSPCANSNLYDYRWHPSPAHAHEMINVDAAGKELSWFDVVTCTKTRSWTLPITVDYGIGSGEGNPSNDGRFVLLGNNAQMFVVDMDPQPPYAPYPNRRIGPVYTFAPESLTTSNPGSWVIDNLSVSASGKYADVKFDLGPGESDSTEDANRVFDIDPTTLALKPHAMAASSLRCGSFAARPDGWIFPLKHHDLALDPYDSNEDVAIGGNSCPGSPLGHLVKVRLRDGKVTELTGPQNESDIIHVSTRNIYRPGWVYVSYYREPGKRYSDEIVAVKTDGSGKVERLCQMHTASEGCYRCEAHPAPSPNGQRVLFASNWAEDCLHCGSASDIKDYVVLDPGAITVDAAPAVPGSVALALGAPTPNPAPGRFAIEYTLPAAGRAWLDLVNVAGRIVQHQDLGSPGAGPHRATVERSARLPSGVYWARLSQAGRHAESRVVLLVGSR